MLSTLEQSLQVTSRRGPADTSVLAATGDSRQVTEGTVFAAIVGTTVDGHRFIPSALSSGASAVLLQEWPASDWPEDVVGLQVHDSRRALGHCAAALHGHPSRDLTVVGITGTNGKTSTATLVRHLLASSGLRAGMLGTTGISWTGRHGDVDLAATHTTPDGPALQATLARMRDDGVQAVAMELSSHALDQGRAAGLDLDVAGWSNVSRDHLDYHGTMEDYAAAKALLLTEILAEAPSARGSVLVVDDPVVAAKAASTDHPVLRVSTKAGATTTGAADIAPTAAPTFSLDGISASIATPEGPLRLRSPLLGAHNLENLLLAVGCALQAGVSLAAIEAALPTAPAASGRMERVQRDDGRGPLVLVDYAHTPDALRAVLATLRPFVPGDGVIVTVFGCGGDRDQGKRPLMGAAAWEGSDAVVITSDNPRTEDPNSILSDIAAGLPDGVTPSPTLTSKTPCALLTARRDAISAAIAATGAGDLVLIAGKGHEMTQDIDGRKVAFDDREEARAALAGFHAPANEPPTGYSDKGRIVKRFPKKDTDSK
ncbi:MAG: UDP-N-acetylmuramoyl-L-alanyl-D-glutamate--2,6-diaminopimelate ligase [Deltaproteobacteria bacterium]|nr:UDP-N-acetylmuramoyl-L-alanyl-D-glutamate--2,6-diaminopimelate ligase [Deltaproteobacteria bacterium]